MSSRHSSSASTKSQMNTIESSVTRLLVATKHLLESLTQWAKYQATETDVSNSYVQLGGDFKMACRAFSSAGVDVTDLGDVPKSLRVVLEEALCEPPSQQSLDRYLPTIRQIIVNLLRNLKLKQTAVREMSRQSQQQIHHKSHMVSGAGSSNSHPVNSKPSSSLQSHQSLNSQPLNSHSNPHSNSQPNPQLSQSLNSLNSQQNPQQQSVPANQPQQRIESYRALSQGSEAAVKREPKPVEPKAQPTPVERRSKEEEKLPELPTINVQSDALKQLQNGDSLKRRASRRFSAYQYAKLTKQSEMPLPKELADGDETPTQTPAQRRSLSPAAAIVPKSSSSITTTPTAATGSSGSSTVDKGETFVFLRLGNRTKKITLTPPISSNSLRLLFIEKFAYSPGGDSFPEVYVQDSMADVPYELEEHLMNDIKSGSILSLNTDSDEAIKSLEAKVAQLQSLVGKVSDSVGDIGSSFKEEVSELRKDLKNMGEKQESAVAAATSAASVASAAATKAASSSSSVAPSIAPSIAPTVDFPASAPSITPPAITATGLAPPIISAPMVTSSMASVAGPPANIEDISYVRRMVTVIKQISTDSRKEATETINQTLKLLEQFKTLEFKSSHSVNRNYIEACHAQLSEDTDELLTEVDDLQDVIEALRKDVAQRGAKPSEEQLQLVRKNVEDARKSIDEMHEYIVSEKPRWKSIWEKELDVVCEEQQFFKLQEDLVDDLKEDLQKALETFTLVEHVSKEHQKSKHQRLKQPNLPLVEPGTNMKDVREAMFSEVTALRPNHQSRIDAIEKAEKVRDKERQAKLANKFETELGGFVEGRKLKKTGGVEEAERLRKLKDEQNLKSQFAAY